MNNKRNNTIVKCTIEECKYQVEGECTLPKIKITTSKGIFSRECVSFKRPDNSLEEDALKEHRNRMNERYGSGFPLDVVLTEKNKPTVDPRLIAVTTIGLIIMFFLVCISMIIGGRI